MLSESDPINREIATLLAESCSELLSAYGVPVAASQKPWVSSDEPLLSGVIGFVGKDVRATCLFAGHDDVIRASCPSGGCLRDWVGELANQLIGRLKMKLLARGVDVSLTTPLAFSGVQMTPWPRYPMQPAVFTGPLGSVAIWLELEAKPGFGLGVLRPLAGETGELLLL